jgi:hypothetical protein
MSIDTPVPTKKPSPEPVAPKTISVKALTFFQAHPSFNARSSISAEPAANKGRVSIEFVPSLRHHRVEMQAAGQPARVFFVQESLVASWEPLL